MCSARLPGRQRRARLRARRGRRRRRRSALRILLETSPFPGVCGRVCPAPCMERCNRREVDVAVDVRDLERALADRADWPAPASASGGAPVAVVGSGPAGLSAAYQLGAPRLPGDRPRGGAETRRPPPVRHPRVPAATRRARRRRSPSSSGTASRPGRAARRPRRPAPLAREHAAVVRRDGPAEHSEVLTSAGAGGGLVQQGLDFLGRRRGRPDRPPGGVGRGRRRRQHGDGRGAHGAASRGAGGPRRVPAHARRDAGHRRGGRGRARGGRRARRVADTGRLLGDDGHGRWCAGGWSSASPTRAGGRVRGSVAGDAGAVELACDRLLLALGQAGDLSLAAARRRTRPPARWTSTTPPRRSTWAATSPAARAPCRRPSAAAAGRRSPCTRPSVTPNRRRTPSTSLLAGPEGRPPARCSARPRGSRSSILARARRGAASPRSAGGSPTEPGPRRRASRGRTLLLLRRLHRVRRAASSTARRACCARPRARLRRLDYDYCKGCGLCVAACPRGVLFTRSGLRGEGAMTRALVTGNQAAGAHAGAPPARPTAAPAAAAAACTPSRRRRRSWST